MIQQLGMMQFRFYPLLWRLWLGGPDSLSPEATAKLPGVQRDREHGTDGTVALQKKGKGIYKKLERSSEKNPRLPRGAARI